MTDHGSTRASVSCAWRRVDRRTDDSRFRLVAVLAPLLRFCHAAVTALA